MELMCGSGSGEIPYYCEVISASGITDFTNKTHVVDLSSGSVLVQTESCIYYQILPFPGGLVGLEAIHISRVHKLAAIY